MARLIVESGGERREIRIAGPVTIGRSPSATIPIDDKTLSREHTQVYTTERGKYFVRDLGSKNGTFLNGQLVKEPELLKSGDRIRVGPVHLTFFARDPEDQPLPAPVPGRTPTRELPPAPPPPPAPVPARARPRRGDEREDDAGFNPAAGVLSTVFMLVVIAVGTLFFKTIFTILLGGSSS